MKIEIVTQAVTIQCTYARCAIRSITQRTCTQSNPSIVTLIYALKIINQLNKLNLGSNHNNNNMNNQNRNNSNDSMNDSSISENISDSDSGDTETLMAGAKQLLESGSIINNNNSKNNNRFKHRCEICNKNKGEWAMSTIKPIFDRNVCIKCKNKK